MQQHNKQSKIVLQLLFVCLLVCKTKCQDTGRRLGNFQEVFAWTQLTYDIDGNMLLQDRSGGDDFDGSHSTRTKRDADNVYFDDTDNQSQKDWNQRPPSFLPWQHDHPSFAMSQPYPWASVNIWNAPRPTTTTQASNRRPTVASATVSPSEERGRFFVQYNNVPMGVERVGNRVFVTVPRRRYGIPSTLNFIDLNQSSNTRSPALRPYPTYSQSRSLISVYRTRADECGRLWMVDTGLLEIPNNPQQIQPPAIVVYDLNTNQQILRYQFKSTDLPANNTPTGLASITVDIQNGDCRNAFAYIPDLTTYGIVVYSLRENDSWRHTHNFFHFNPTAGTLQIAGQRFQWSDGIFSITLNQPAADGCRTAYFHPLISTQEFSVSTCVLKNRTSVNDSEYWSFYSEVGDRGENSQSTMHVYHPGSRVMFYADVGRDSISCWNTGNMLNPSNVGILARDTVRLSYPSDIHVTDDEVWVMANALPRFGYSRLDPNEYNFFVYRGNVQDLISGTVCAGRSSSYALG